MFEALGLSETTEAVYLALLELPDADVGQLAAHVGLDEGSVREALDELARMSLLRSTWESQAPRLVSPQIGLSALVARHQAEVVRRQQQLDESKAAIALVLAKHAKPTSRQIEPGTEYVEGIDAIRERIAVIAQGCRWEAASFMPGGAQSAASLRASRMLDADAIERGVRLRTVYLDSVRNDQATFEYAHWLSELGSEVRTAPTLPLRMLIVDREVAVVPVDTENSGSLAMVVTQHGVLAALVALFQTIWRTAAPLGATRRREKNGLSAQEFQVVRLLGAGHTDEAIARRIGVSVRTARRIASELLARLDARSRFQAGAKALAHGWITNDDLD